MSAPHGMIRSRSGRSAKPPFARSARPARRCSSVASGALAALADGHRACALSAFLAALTDVQHRMQDGLARARYARRRTRIARAREFGMPPLDRGALYAPMPPSTTTFERLLGAGRWHRDAASRRVPRSQRVKAADDAARERDGARACSSNASRSKRSPSIVFVAAALQVHFARLAARLDAERAGAGRRRRLPGLRRRAGRLDGRRLARRAQHALLRLLAVRHAVELCARQMHAVRLDQGHRLPGRSKTAPSTVKAETCDACHGYVKILQQAQDPTLDPLADDVASLGLDLLVRELGYRRGGRQSVPARLLKRHGKTAAADRRCAGCRRSTRCCGIRHARRARQSSASAAPPSSTLFARALR